MGPKISFILILFLYSLSAAALDLEQIVSGGDVPDELGQSPSPDEGSPYIIENSAPNAVENYKVKKGAQPDFIFEHNLKQIAVKDDPRNKYKETGYVLPTTFEKEENYLETDKDAMARDFRKLSSGGINLTYIKDTYSYQSENDIINRTIGEGHKHIKGGTLHFRSDQYFFRTDYLNTFWLIGAGVGFNSGRGLFVRGQRSNTTFNLWEVPADIGLGFDIPLYHWFKVSAAAGPSAMVLYQNRNDFQQGEKGRNKTQVSHGQFANAQFRINLSGFSSETAYDLFTSSKITNLYLNLEGRYQNYQNFQDDIKISGTSLGIGFTFEYL